jgi:hypothetical protein
MASTTYLQVVNKVLTRLRESTVASVTENSYSTLIGAIVNQVKTEIEDTWRWHALRDTYNVPTVSGTASYVLTGSGPDTVILDAWNYTKQWRMRRGTYAQMNQNFFGVGTDIQTGSPELFIEAGLNTDFDIQIDIWPKPTAVETLYFNVYKPQAELSSGSTVPLVPIAVLVEGSVSRAMAERGDDGGIATAQQESIYRDLLQSAIARDVARDQSELNWSVV